MARGKNNSENQNNQIIEDQDMSSEDIEVYKPTGIHPEELEADEEAYNLLEYIDLEWPSLSIDCVGSKVILGTYPAANTENIDLVEIEIENADFQNLSYRKQRISHSINKIRAFKSIFAVSDTHLIKYDSRFKMMAEVPGSYGFGLCVSGQYVIVGCRDGMVEVYNHDLGFISKFKAGDSSIECVGYLTRSDTNGSFIITGSVDHTLKVFDTTGNIIQSFQNDSEINCLEVRNNKIVFGDDNGKIHLIDLVSEDKTVYEWHSSSIAFVRWKDDDVFVSGSDEQVCIWDITLEEEEISIEAPKNLLFVHQGQMYYKDCAFNHNRVIVTSEEGLCVFEPVSFFDIEEKAE